MSNAGRITSYAVGLLACLYLLFAGCTTETDTTLFKQVPPESSGISFSNDLTYSDSFNVYTYRNFYAGGGVAIGDVNGDDRPDIYLTANQKDNKLYLNRGDFEFEDVTEQAGVAGTKPWSTGASMADVNGDGHLDIYVANSGQFGAEQRKNELFINNGDGTFTERADEFGIADSSNTIHAAFFDYDGDGDLDVYVLNNYASKPIENYNLERNLRQVDHFRGGDKLYRNDGGTFTEVTERAGIYSSEIGFGLGVSVGDVNRDGWPDLYVANDFFERDYLYLNNGDGTFREVLPEKLSAASSTSMGGDIADLNNDGHPEIFSTDMLPVTEERLKTVTDFVGWSRLQELKGMGYHYLFARNMLHYNNGDGTFSEIGRYAGVEATGWSWGALMADFNLDGRRDIFVPNGFYKDVTDKDFILRVSQPKVQRSIYENGRFDYEKLVEMTPSVPLSNYMFANQGAMRFANRADEWGLGEPGFSSGAAYGDLDRDGDLDLVVNNVNMEAFLYRNRAVDTGVASDRAAGAETTEPGWLELELDGEAPNTQGIGAQVTVVAGGTRIYAEQMPQRGFQASVDPALHVGLGAGVSTVDTVRVRWPDGRVSQRTGIAAHQRLTIRQAEATRPAEARPTDARSAPRAASSGPVAPLLTDVTEEVGLSWRHRESAHNDFERSPLLMHMRSTEGPPLCTSDLTGDGRDDVFVGGARGQAGALFVQNDGGGFTQASPQPALDADQESEDTACAFVDATGDGHAELYVGSGSSEFAAGSAHLADRLYQAGPDGRLTRLEDALPERPGGPAPTGAVEPIDVDGDGDQDLFVGDRMGLPRAAAQASRSAPRGFGAPVGGRVLVRDGTGRFEDVTSEVAPGLRAERLQAAGITTAAWGDVTGDGAPDLVVAGEWMPLSVFVSREGRLERANPADGGLGASRGWWQRLKLADLDADGDLDLVGGNHGLNSRFEARPDEPVQMWAGDFNEDGRLEQILATYTQGAGPYPVALWQHIIQVLPRVKQRFPSFEDYAETTVPELFSEEQRATAHRYRAEQMATVVGWNEGGGQFRVEALPFRAQLAPMYGIAAADLLGDGRLELLLGGNLEAVRPQAGPYEASRGALLRLDTSRTYRAVPARRSGFESPGEIRGVAVVARPGRSPLIVVVRNNDRLQAFSVAKGQ